MLTIFFYFKGKIFSYLCRWSKCSITKSVLKNTECLWNTQWIWTLDFKGLCASRILLCFKESLLLAKKKMKEQEDMEGRGHSEAQTTLRWMGKVPFQPLQPTLTNTNLCILKAQRCRYFQMGKRVTDKRGRARSEPSLPWGHFRHWSKPPWPPEA